MELDEHKQAVEPILPKGKGRSYALAWQMLYYVKLLRYVTNPHLKTINPRFSQICATEKLDTLCDLGYLRQGFTGVYISTPKTTEVLKLAGYKSALLPEDREGSGGVNELLITEALIKLLPVLHSIKWKSHTQHALFYPQFPKEEPYIKPDAMIVIGGEGRYKIEFVEVEAKKPYWEERLMEKERNYRRLAQDEAVYKYWCNLCKPLGLPKPDIRDFCFSVICIGNKKMEFEGWKFE